MYVTVNGNKYHYERPITISEMLVNLRKQSLPLAVRVNGKTVSRKNFESTLVKDGDEISVIVFLGGG